MSDSATAERLISILRTPELRRALRNTKQTYEGLIKDWAPPHDAQEQRFIKTVQLIEELERMLGP